MFIAKWLVMSVAVFASSYVVPGIEVDGFGAALVAALFLGLINIFIRPLLVILNLPMIIVSLGFFLIVLNAILLYVVAAIVNGFYIHSFFSAIIGSIFISIVSAILNVMFKPKH